MNRLEDKKFSTREIFYSNDSLYRGDLYYKKLVAHHLLPASTLQSAVVSAVAHSATSTLQSTAASAVAHSAATSDGSKMKLLQEVSNREIS